MLVQVAVARKLADYRDQLTYRVPDSLKNVVRLGSLVLVPMGRGNQQVNGYVTGFLPDDALESCKDILAVLETETLLSQELVELAVWMSNYYLCPCYYILEYMLPKFARSKKKDVAVWLDETELAMARMIFLEPDARSMAELIQEKREVAVLSLQKHYPDAERLLQQLKEAELVRVESRFQQQGCSKTEFVYESCIEQEQLDDIRQQLGRAVKQWEILRYLTYEGACDGKKLCSYWPNYAALAKELMKKNLITRKKVQVQRFNTDSAVFHNEKQLTLNPEQQNALDAIINRLENRTGGDILLHGVTGSGKTEVYLRTLRYVLEHGDGAMVLVPEIALTPQLIGRFRAVLGEYVEVLHSNMSDGERFDAWQRLYRGETRVVVGVRSAVFAPVQNLRLIIMDEEHETTFKQSEPDPRYHAREVARYRMQMNQGLLLLGSATPSVQSYYETVHGGGTLLTMHNRAQKQPLPEVQIVNMAREFQAGSRSMFSSVLMQTMEESLRNGEQVILFLNRRGFSSAIVCRECGHTLTCEKCSIALTYHKDKNLAKCHYCDYMTPAPKQCPHCGSRFIRYMGSGTELVEAEVQKLWPWIKTDRMDLDTTQNKDAHNQILERFARGETQILIGTQMVAKGLDFPNVTTVGVLMADMILNLPDYTASERTFQLLTQVAGRAGRGDKPGRVIVQTYNPEHYSIESAQQHDYSAFYEKEIQMRELMVYPPFCYMIRILVSDFQPDGLLEQMQEMADKIAEQYPTLELLGPSEAPVSIVRKRHRFHLILKGQYLDLLREAAEYGQKFMNLSRKSKTLRILIDVEPSSVL
ncbi:MAG: primosomal protein N' [Peptococcaceae bacterium]|nr:primosomal protein N' [Peptococcaceae bacterium]